jgi:CRISPR-associated protein (TIGR02584 family)
MIGLDPAQPGSYPRRVLLAVTGMSPQIVTETLYALAVKPPEPAARFVPTEIHLITTRLGRDQANLNLLSERPGWFRRLREDYDLPEIRFDPECIHVMTDSAGQPLEDIRTPEDNEQAADCITERVRELTRDVQTALHASLAGGRKTMGFYLGYALSLFARPQDRLSHVLVPSPYESHQDFYYPPPRELILQINRGKTSIAVDARDAQISLAEIPVVSLRQWFPQALRDYPATFKGVVRAARESLAAPELILDPSTLRISAGRQVLKLSPGQFALLAVLAYRTCHQLEPIRAPVKGAIDLKWSGQYLADLRAACGTWHVPTDVEERLENGVDQGYFSENLSRLERELNQKLGASAYIYRIDRGQRPRRRYQLALARGSIRFDSIPDVSNTSSTQL